MAATGEGGRFGNADSRGGGERDPGERGGSGHGRSKALIAGGGIGGLAAALALHQAGFEVEERKN